MFLSQEQEQEEIGEYYNLFLAPEETRSHFYQRRVYLELELQDNKVTSASKMIRSMTTHFSFARRGGLAYQVDLWELRVDEVESVVLHSHIWEGHGDSLCSIILY